jgi:hypothetical protein
MIDYEKLQADLNTKTEPNTDLLKWEKNSTLLGEVLSITEEVSPKYGESMKLVVKTPGGKAITTFCPTVLRNRIREQKVMEGMIVKIKCVNEHGGKEGNTKLFHFEAFWDEEDTVEEEADKDDLPENIK